MRKINCRKCNEETEHLMLVHNKNLYQFQYEECQVCGNQVLMKKVPMNEDFDLVRRKSVY